MTPGRCRSCPAKVYWLQNVTTGRLAPIDVEPDASGNVVVDLTLGVYSVLGRRADAAPTLIDLNVDQALHTSHFQTCPKAAAHRPTRTPAAAAR